MKSLLNSQTQAVAVLSFLLFCIFHACVTACDSYAVFYLLAHSVITVSWNGEICQQIWLWVNILLVVVYVLMLQNLGFHQCLNTKNSWVSDIVSCGTDLGNYIKFALSQWSIQFKIKVWSGPSVWHSVLNRWFSIPWTRLTYLLTSLHSRVVTMPTHLELFQKGGGQARPDGQAAHWPDCPEEEYSPVGERRGRREIDR